MMDSIRNLFNVGRGPSSSHTMGPARAAKTFLEKDPGGSHTYRVTLYGSLAATGKGHLTDQAILEVFGDRHVEILWRPDECLPEHPNGMRFESLNETGHPVRQWDAYSVGGGAVLDPSSPAGTPDRYPHHRMAEILEECDRHGLAYWEYVERHEGGGIRDFLACIWDVMQATIRKGLETGGVLPGGLGVNRKAGGFLRKAEMATRRFRSDALLAAYAYAVSEENAAGGRVVTAPTCGSSGVLPSVLYHLQNAHRFPVTDMVHALTTAGLIGNLIKHNASISGAQVGCQGEIGTACAMAAGAATQLHGGSIRQIEYAAEMGLEHHLGLTCDPVAGLVQIPCIERNAHAATRAVSCSHFALLSDGAHKVGFDDVVEVMRDTGFALPSLYKETSEGGLAKVYKP